jgi:hypothetical protein
MNRGKGMTNLKHKLAMAIQSIEQTTELFYQQKRELGYQNLESTLALLTQVISDIFEYKSQGNEIGIDESQLIIVLTKAMKAIEMKDTILLSDILLYDLKELFEKL